MSINEDTSSSTRSIKTEIENFKRDAILREAVAQFYSNGYETTSVEAIGEALGVTKPYIYARFRSKSELLIEICRLGASPAAQTVEFATTLFDAPPAERLQAIVRHFVTRQIERRMEVALFFREANSLPAAELDTIDQSRLQFHQMLRQVLEDGKETGEFQIASTALTASAIGGMASWVFTWFQQDGRMVQEFVSEELSHLALRTAGFAA